MHSCRTRVCFLWFPVLEAAPRPRCRSPVSSRCSVCCDSLCWETCAAVPLRQPLSTSSPCGQCVAVRAHHCLAPSVWIFTCGCIQSGAEHCLTGWPASLLPGGLGPPAHRSRGVCTGTGVCCVGCLSRSKAFVWRSDSCPCPGPRKEAAGGSHRCPRVPRAGPGLWRPAVARPHTVTEILWPVKAILK